MECFGFGYIKPSGVRPFTNLERTKEKSFVLNSKVDEDYDERIIQLMVTVNFLLSESSF